MKQHKTQPPGARTARASVLMCVYNERPVYLRQAVESVQKQTFSDYEFIIVNDGSTSPETLHELRVLSQQDDRIEVVTTSNQGLTKALNFGLTRCRTEMVFRHDSDDWSSVDRFRQQYQFLRENPEHALVGSNFNLCSENGTVVFASRLPITHARVLETLNGGRSAFCHGAVLLRRSAILTLGGYREALACAQDYDLFWRVSERFPTTNIDEPLYFHRRTANSISTTRTQLQDTCAVCIYRLAEMRKSGIEDFDAAWSYAEKLVSSPLWRPKTMIRQADHLMISGLYASAARAYMTALRTGGDRRTTISKLIRLSVFAFCPPIRPLLFRRHHSSAAGNKQ